MAAHALELLHELGACGLVVAAAFDHRCECVLGGDTGVEAVERRCRDRGVRGGDESLRVVLLHLLGDGLVAREHLGAELGDLRSPLGGLLGQGRELLRSLRVRQRLLDAVECGLRVGEVLQRRQLALGAAHAAVDLTGLRRGLPHRCRRLCALEQLLDRLGLIRVVGHQLADDLRLLRGKGGGRGLVLGGIAPGDEAPDTEEQRDAADRRGADHRLAALLLFLLLPTIAAFARTRCGFVTDVIGRLGRGAVPPRWRSGRFFGGLRRLVGTRRCWCRRRCRARSRRLLASAFGETGGAEDARRSDFLTFGFGERGAAAFASTHGRAPAARGVPQSGGERGSRRSTQSPLAAPVLVGGARSPPRRLNSHRSAAAGSRCDATRGQRSSSRDSVR